MALSLQQVQRQSQQLIMTPQMQQSIQLLQMNTVELEQLAQTELLENPFLELTEEQEDPEARHGEAEARESPSEDRGNGEGGDGDDFLSPVEREIERAHTAENGGSPAEDRGGAESDSEAGGAESAAERDSRSAAEEPSEYADSESFVEHPEQFAEVDCNWDDYYEGSENSTYMTRGVEEEERDFSEYTAARVSLYEHLMWQLRVSSLEGREVEIGEYLIGCLDEDGYLEAAAVTEAAAHFKVDPEDIEDVLYVIQEFEPVGVGARTPAECLLIQMHGLGMYSRDAKRILEGHFEDLQRKKFKNIAKALELPEERVLQIFNQVRRLEPRPGRMYSKDSAQYIEPDVYVKLIDGNVTIYLNEGSSSKLSISRLYRRMLRLQARAMSSEDKAFATDKFRNALMLLKNIERRKSTILRVTESIMQVQRDFLDKGVEALKPLTLREVADMVGMHESTIARVTSRKYVDTPQGLYSLKFFFSSAIESSSGNGSAVSSRTIKDRIQGFIAEENPKQPLSDQKIAERLSREGYTIARRTVAKYREQINILPAKLRKEAKG